MPLNPGDARRLRELREPALRADTRERRMVRALAWLGRRVTLQLTGGATVTGTVEGVAALPVVGRGAVLPQPGEDVVLLRRSVSDVLEGYRLLDVADVRDAPGTGEFELPVTDRRDRF